MTARFLMWALAEVFLKLNSPAASIKRNFLGYRRTVEMVCQTVRVNQECSFMSKKGCNFFGGSCQPIIEKCDTCGKTVEYDTKKYCGVYPNPASKWLTGKCPTATHIKLELNEAAQKVNQLT